MESLFTYCAIIGGILFVGQLILSFTGLGGDESDIDFDSGDIDVPEGADISETELHWDGHDSIDAHPEGDLWFVGILSVRSLIAAVTVFGLAGQGALANGFSPLQTSFIALGCGVVVLYAVGWIFKELAKVRSDGTVNIQQTVGCNGKVYLPVPAAKKSAGKVTVTVAGRTMEYLAMTAGEKLSQGTPIQVVAVLTPQMVEVQAVNTSSE